MNSNIYRCINSFVKPCIALAITALLFIFLILLSGCEGLTGTVPQEDDPVSVQEGEETVTEPDQGETTQEEDTVDNSTSEEVQEPVEKVQDNGEEDLPEESEEIDQEETPDTITIRVYFADEMGEYLIGEARTIPYQNRYSNALVELMKLPVDEKLITLIPDSAKINSFNIEDGIAHINFSKEFQEERFVSDKADILLVYSIVSTLTEFPDINAVVFYIEGERLDILGMLDLSEPLFRKNDLILK
jgi:spore germination protein GerM